MMIYSSDMSIVDAEYVCTMLRTRCFNRCFLVDESGFIIAHHDWTDSSRVMFDVHITQLEPEIAEILIETGYMSYSVCINVLHIRLQYFWKVRLLFESL